MRVMKFKNTKTSRSQSVAFAACSFVIDANGEVQLLPSGEFRSRDGRPPECAHWVTNAEIAARLIADIAGLANPVVIDYEHQTLLSADNGQPAPAAGWFTAAGMQWREGFGLFATVEWTERAKLHIEAGEYKYLSPVIAYDKKSGAIKKIFNAALTNNAAIDGMEEVTARLTAALTQEKLTMDLDELLEQLRWMLNLPLLATPEEVVTELNKAVSAIKTAQPEAVAAAGFSIAGLVATLGTQVAALKTAAPDPAKFVPVDAMAALQTEVAALRNEKVEREVGEVVAAALAAGKLLPPQEKWARDLGKANLTALNEYLETASPIAALSGTQTNGLPPAGQAEGALSESELVMCTSMGVDPEAFKKTKAETAVAV
jgi:phage I-like protein